MSRSSRFRLLTRAGARFALGVSLGVCLSAAQVAPTPLQAPVEPSLVPRIWPAEGAGPALWVVRDADSTLYLFGTVHVLRPDTPWGSERVDRAFDSASEIWLEIANPDDHAAAAPLIQQHGFDPSRPLSSILNADDHEALDKAARSIGSRAENFDTMRPWMAGLALAVASLAKAGYKPQSGAEMVLLERARKAGKPIRGFETIDQQLQMLAGMSEEAQLIFMREALKDFDNSTALFETLIASWSSGDTERLDRLVGQEMKAASPEVYEAVLVRRNTDWATQIQTMLEGSGTAFIAVGGGHLAGEDSVQAILERRGVTVTLVD